MPCRLPDTLTTMNVRCSKISGKTMPDEQGHFLSSTACLTDLPEDLLTNILQQLPLKTKCKAQAACRAFRDILWKPLPGSFVWGVVNLEDPLFEAASLAEMARQASSPRASHGKNHVESLRRDGVTVYLTCQPGLSYRGIALLLCSWLTQRVHGILALLYIPGYASRQSAPEAAAAELQREYHIATSLLPRLSALLPPAAEILLDSRAGEPQKTLPGSL